MKKVELLFLFISIIVLFGCEDTSTEPPVILQNYSLFGRVTEDVDSLDILSNVIVSTGMVTTETDADGLFKLENLQEGEHSLVLTKSDFKSKTLTLELKSDTTLIIGLQRERPEYFPDNPGCKWSYSVYDSLHNESSIIGLEIIERYISNDTLPVTSFSITEKLSEPYIMPVFNFGDEVFNLIFDSAFKVPYIVGDKYGAEYYSSEVVSTEEVVTPAGTFFAYKIVTRLPAEDDFIQNISWAVPEVGIVKVNKYKTGIFGVSENKTWKLVSFEIK